MTNKTYAFQPLVYSRSAVMDQERGELDTLSSMLVLLYCDRDTAYITTLLYRIDRVSNITFHIERVIDEREGWERATQLYTTIASSDGGRSMQHIHFNTGGYRPCFFRHDRTNLTL